MSQQENNAVEKYAAVVERMGLPIEGDVAELSKAPVGGLMGWHELAVIVRHIEEGVGYNYPKLAANLCQHLGYAKAALATTTEQLAAARQELGEQEAEEMQLVQEIEALKRDAEPEGDGGIWALQRLADYTHEGGHNAALANIRAAAHNLGWCIDSSGCDQIAPIVGVCPLCDYDSTPRPAPAQVAVAPPAALAASQVIEALAGLLTPEGEHYPDPAAARAYEIRLRVNVSVGIAAQKLGLYEQLSAYHSGGGLPLERGADAPEPVRWHGVRVQVPDNGRCVMVKTKHPKSKTADQEVGTYCAKLGWGRRYGRGTILYVFEWRELQPGE